MSHRANCLAKKKPHNSFRNPITRFSLISKQVEDLRKGAQICFFQKHLEIFRSECSKGNKTISTQLGPDMDHYFDTTSQKMEVHFLIVQQNNEANMYRGIIGPSLFSKSSIILDIQKRAEGN